MDLHFWYDFSSPFSYLGSTQIEKLAARAGARLHWRPMLLGAVFKALGGPDVPLFAMSEAKRKYHGRELYYWSSWWEVPFQFSSHFPLKTVTALRLALLAGDRIGELTAALYKAAWVDNLNIDKPEVLKGILSAAGFDAEAMLARTQDPATKQQLIANTEEAVKAGVFGAPTCVVKQPAGDLLFWGQDRLDLVEKALGGWRPAGE